MRGEIEMRICGLDMSITLDGEEIDLIYFDMANGGFQGFGEFLVEKALKMNKAKKLKRELQLQIECELDHKTLYYCWLMTKAPDLPDGYSYAVPNCPKCDSVLNKV